jgi:tetratricopeptide (TPR) repeat protein
MFFKQILLSSLVVLLFSCGANPKNSSDKFQKLKITNLEEKDMFTLVKVKAFMDSQDEKTAEYNNLFLKGLDSFKNKKNLDSANHYFNESILDYPSNIAYYELGNVLLEKKEYKKAIYAYEMAEKLGYEPFSKVLYNISCAHSLLNETELSAQYLEFALQAGYSNIDNINKDSDLTNLRKDKYLFETHLKQGLKGMSDADNLFWLQFKRNFSKTSFPLKLDENLDILLLNDETHISYDFEKYIAEMRDDKFSREVSKGFYYLSEIKETKNYVALVYVIKEEFYGSDSPLIFRLATFTNEGKLIDKKEIAGRSDFSKPLKSAIIKNDMSIEITSFETIFEKNVDEEGYYDNKIVKKNKIGEETFTINKQGKIIKKEMGDLSKN